MTDSASPRDPFNGFELFRAQRGEWRRPMDQLAGAPDFDLRAFVAAVKAYIETHPKLETRILAGENLEDDLIIQWRWRR